MKRVSWRKEWELEPQRFATLLPSSNYHQDLIGEDNVTNLVIMG